MGLVLLIPALWMTAPACATKEECRAFSGPVPYRSVMPLSLIFPSPPPETAVPLRPGRTRLEWNTLYGSALIKDTNAVESATVDGEFLRTSFYVKHGLADRVELGAELPLVHYTSGFLDGFIERFHDFFGFPQGRRDKNPDDQYEVSYVKNSNEFYTAEEDGIHLGDIPIYLKVGLVEPGEQGFGLAVRGTLELPTGDSDKGFGSGKLDGGLGIIAQQAFLSSWACYLNFDYMFNQSPSSFKDVSAANVAHGSFALEKAFSDVFAVLVQTDLQTPLLEGFNVGRFDVPQWTVTAGLSWRMAESGLLKFFFTEGITTNNSPDFVLGAGLGFDF